MSILLTGMTVGQLGIALGVVAVRSAAHGQLPKAALVRTISSPPPSALPSEAGTVTPVVVVEPEQSAPPAPAPVEAPLPPPPPRAPARRLLAHPTPLPAAFAPSAGPSKYPVFRDRWDYWGPRIRGCESWGDPGAPPNYQAENRASGASGAYQFLDSTWGGRYGVPKARMATPSEQEQTAYELFEAQGTRPWNASYRCWKGQPPAQPQVAAASPAPPTTAPAPAASTTSSTSTTSTTTSTTTSPTTTSTAAP